MDAVEFIKERSRMCKSFNKCSYGCPAWGGSCKLETGTYLECEATKQVEIVEEWSAAHPRKTRQSVFLEKYPEAKIDGGGCLELCPCMISTTHRDEYGHCAIVDTKCFTCRREFWQKVVG